MAETMNETQGDVYVRRDVFEARMERILATASLALRKIFKPSLTLDDTKNIVRAEIANQSGGGK